MAQKFTQRCFKSLYNIVKMDKYGITTPFIDLKGNLTAFFIRINGNLVTVSVNGRISVEKGGILKESGRYYGRNFASELKSICNCYKTF